MKKKTILALGVIGHVGPYLVDEAVKLGYKVRCFIWDARKCSNLPEEVDRIEARLDDVSRLIVPMQDVDGIIVQTGDLRSVGNNPEMIDYRSLRNVLDALDGRPVPIVVLSSVDSSSSTCNLSHECYFNMRMCELMARCSGLKYTIVRSNKIRNGLSNHYKLASDRIDSVVDKDESARRAGSLSARQLASVLVNALFSEHAGGKSFDVFGTEGEKTVDFDAFFNTIPPDNFDASAVLQRQTDQVSNGQPPEIIDEIRTLAHAFAKGKKRSGADTDSVA